MHRVRARSTAHRASSSGQSLPKTRGVRAMSICVPIMHTRPRVTMQASRAWVLPVQLSISASTRPSPRPPSRPTAHRTTGRRGRKARVSPEASLRRMR